MSERTASNPQAHPRANASAWAKTVRDLSRTIAGWVEKEGWLVSAQDAERAEDRVGSYRVPVLRIKTPDGILLVEPIARDVVDAEGRVDLYAWPSLRRMVLIRRDGRWGLRTDSGVDWPRKWGRAAFLDLARQLTSLR